MWPATGDAKCFCRPLAIAAQPSEFFFSSRRRHTRCSRDWSSDVCSSDLEAASIVSQPTLVVGSQDGSRFVKATARQNVAEGYLLAHRHPEPAQLRGHIRSEERRVGKECEMRW